MSHAMSSSVCLKLVSFFRAALMSCSSFVSLRAVYRAGLVRVEPLFRHCDDELRIGRVPCRHHCSPMRRVSKRLTANVFREPEVWAENSAADAVHTEAARLLQRRNHLIDHYRDLTKDFSADRVQSTNHDRGSGLELYRPKGSSDRLRLEPASNGLPTNRS